MVDWPEPLTISSTVRNLKRKFIQSFEEEPGEEDGDEPARDLNYIVAVSSGKAVTEEIPKQIGRRAGWASQQGANFVEILIENPAQLIMDQDMLINLADRLNLHYNIHSSTNLAYGMSYRVGRGNGYDRAHEYTQKLLKSIRRFRDKLGDTGNLNAEDGYPRLYAVNAHMAVQEMPPEEERLATDVSVDPFGEEMEHSRIFDVKEARLAIWRHFIWDFLGIQNDIQDFSRVLNLFEETRDVQDFVQAELVDILNENGYISDGLLGLMRDPPEAPVQGQRGEQNARLFGFRITQQYDVPGNVNALKRHVNGRGLAQQIATLDPVEDGFQPDVARRALLTTGDYEQEEVTGMSTQEVLETAASEFGFEVPDVKALDLTKRSGEGGWDDIVTEAQNNVLEEDSDAFEEVEELLAAEGDYDNDMAAEAMQKIVRMRMLHDDFNKESSIFRYIIPLWMPFAEHEQVRQIWEGITEKPFDDPDELIEWLYDPENDGDDAAMNKPRKEEDVVAAATGAYVWGHFTQDIPGYDKSLIELVKEAGIYWSFESHMAGDIENARIWKPKDFVEVVKAINATPIEHVNEEGEEVEEPIPRTRVTIDMEHIATQKVDPMWVIDPNEEAKEEGYKGLDDGDGRYILINHVTHPYIGEGGHHHGPIRRGDTLVYRYIYELIDKGMATDPDRPSIIMYEIGAEKTETLYMLRLILNMIEHDITPGTLEGDEATKIITKDEPGDLREYLIQEFFGVTDTEVQHEWQEIFEHALDPLDNLLEAPSASHTWLGRAATEGGTRPEEWQEEQYR